jgi:hypothetical protein
MSGGTGSSEEPRLNYAGTRTAAHEPFDIVQTAWCMPLAGRASALPCASMRWSASGMSTGPSLSSSSVGSNWASSARGGSDRGQNVTAAFDGGPAQLAAIDGIDSKSSSHRTPRWRGPDSNHRSRPKRRPALTRATSFFAE